MKEFRVNRNSWHYKMIADDDWKRWPAVHEAKDFCTYWRRVIGYLLIFGVLSGLRVGGLCAIIGWIGYGLLFQTKPFLIGFGFLLAMFALAYSVVLLFVGFNKIKEKFNSEESIIGTKYRSWKERYCPKIVYEESKE